MTASALYDSVVRHRRFRPTGHQFRYRVYSLLLDLDEVDEIAARIPIFSHNRWNLVSFHDRDHGPRDGTSLRVWFEQQVAAAGLDLGGGRVRVLVYPRIFGYTFNPLTVWFGYDRHGALRAVLYEIHNTFGQARSQLVVLDGRGEVLRHGFPKMLHVSPFFDRTGGYEMALTPPSEIFRLAITYRDADGSMLLTAAQTGARIPLTTRTLLAQFITKPLLTMKVIGGIHLHALRLWRKGIRYRPVPREEPASRVGISRPVGLAGARDR